MIDINQWMKQYQDTVKRIFGSRILFIGLQGSYGRGEANANSDIDVVLILDKVAIADLKEYKEAIEKLPYRTLICGFVSGKEELEGWCRTDLFQFYHDTISYYGNLDAIIPAPTDADARSAVLTGACNLYHACSHNYLHGSDMETLKALYKSAFFVLLAKHYSETGNHVRSHSSLNIILTGIDLTVLQFAEQIKTGADPHAELERYSELMLQWTKKLISEYKK
jgi:uncharacterized protein